MSEINKNEANWWKWGNPEKSSRLEDFPKLITYLEEKWNKKLVEDLALPDRISQLAPSEFGIQQFKKIFPELKNEQFSTDNETRLRYAYGKGYHDAIRVLKAEELTAPDFVLFPESSEDVAHILSRAKAENIKVITFSGGSNVTSAVEIEDKKGLTCCLNMTRMNRLLELDETSHYAIFQTGIYGPALEALLSPKGFTMGHFPQSFEYSTLGGWLATRSAGQESGLYGKIEDMVLGIKVVTPVGIIKQFDFPHHASGIDIFQLFIGSEGTLGVITEAKMRIHYKPENYKWAVALFKDFRVGSEALRDMVQNGLHPAIARLSDAQETTILTKFSNAEAKGLKAWIQNRYKSRLQAQGFTAPCMLMMRFAIRNKAEEKMPDVAKAICKKHGAKILPASVSSTWEENRFALPYLRETVVQHRIMIDMFETIIYWKSVIPLYEHVKKRMSENSDFFEKGNILFCHISHIYETGASLYFTMLAQQEEGAELEQWPKIKAVVSDAIEEFGGAISHHHGVGKDHRKWYRKYLSPEVKALMQAIKNHLDPTDILNPGKLFDEKKD